MVVFTVLFGIIYTFALTGIGQLIFPSQVNGSLLKGANGQVVGSSLIGQPFLNAKGDPLPQYFQPRPSAAGTGYAGDSSSGSNYGPENADLITAIGARKAQVAQFNAVADSQVPADAVTASGSGLDPDISPEYAAIQVERVAKARSLSVDRVRELVAAHTQGRDLGYLGEPTVNVLELNLALDKLGG
jgi:K+-transporting ATPase ATPase C chain